MTRRAWAWWVARCARDEDARPMALVRVLVPMAAALDLLQAARLGLAPVLFRPWDAGGLSKLKDDAAFLDALSPDQGGPVALVVAIVSFLLASAGVASRSALLVGALAYAQLGHLYPPGDRAIDRLLRTAMLLLVCSGAHRRLSLTGARRDRIPAWPADTLRFLLVIVYLSAGVGKLAQQPAWLAGSGTPVLYRIMTDPLAAHVDPHAALAWWPVLRVLGWGTIALELSSPLILTRWAPYWAVCGAMMHLGIAATMDLGMFSWGMLALYPVLFAGWIGRAPSRPSADLPR